MSGLEYVISLIDKNFSGGMAAAKRQTQGLDTAVGKTNKQTKSLESASQQGFGGMVKWAKRAAVATGLVFGLGQAIAFGQEVTNVTAQMEGYNNAIQFASGADGAKNLEFLDKTIKDLNLDMKSSYKGFQTLTGSLKGTKLEGQATRDIFEAVGVAGTVIGLSAEQSEGAFLALSQMASKGKVQAEELRGQLGERIPGALGIAARAMGVNQMAFNKMLDSGQIYAEDFLPKFAKELKATFQDGLPAAAKSMQAAINKKNNAMLSFQETFGNAVRPAIIGVLEMGTKLFGFLGDLLAHLDPVKKAFNGVWDALGPIREVFDALSSSMMDSNNEMGMAEMVMNGIAKAIEIVTPAIGFLAEIIGWVWKQSNELHQILKDTTVGLFESAEGSEFLSNVMDTLRYTWELLKPAVGAVYEVLKVTIPIIGEVVKSIMGVVNWLFKWGEKTVWVQDLFEGLKTAVKAVFMDIANAAKTILGGVGDLLIGLFTLDMDKIASGMKQAFSGVGAMIDGKLDTSNSKLAEPINKKVTITEATNKTAGQDLFSPENGKKPVIEGTKPDNTNKLSGSVSGSGGGGGKNVTFQIESLVKQLTIQPQTLKEGAQDIEKQMKDVFIRLIRDVELQHG